MGWLTLGAMVAVSSVLYTAQLLGLIEFGPVAQQRPAMPSDLGMGNVGPTAAIAYAGEIARRERGVSSVLLVVGTDAGGEGVQVPIPPGAIPTGDAERQSDRVALFVPSGLEASIDFYRDALAARGWHEVWSQRVYGAFDERQRSSVTSAFCRSADGPSVVVDITTGTGDAVQVGLLVVSERDEPCGPGDGPTPL